MASAYRNGCKIATRGNLFGQARQNPLENDDVETGLAVRRVDDEIAGCVVQAPGVDQDPGRDPRVEWLRRDDGERVRAGPVEDLTDRDRYRLMQWVGGDGGQPEAGLAEGIDGVERAIPDQNDGTDRFVPREHDLLDRRGEEGRRRGGDD